MNTTFEQEYDRIMRDMAEAIIYQHSLGNPYGLHRAFEEAQRRVGALARSTPERPPEPSWDWEWWVARALKIIANAPVEAEEIEDVIAGLEERISALRSLLPSPPERPPSEREALDVREVARRYMIEGLEVEQRADERLLPDLLSADGQEYTRARIELRALMLRALVTGSEPGWPPCSLCGGEVAQATEIWCPRCDRPAAEATTQEERVDD